MEDSGASTGNFAFDVYSGVVAQAKSALHVDEVASVMTMGNVSKVTISVISVILFWAVYRGLRHFVRRAAEKTMQERTVMLILKVIKYVFYVLMTMYVLGLFGIDLTAIWGAAGIAGVALGFAAQTSVSNLISGLFVLTEKTMRIGDFIEVDGVSGTIDSVGLLAVKVHTLDNQLIRIPNSTIINTKLKNYSSYKYRRYVFDFSVDYSTDLEKAIEVLKKVPSLCPTVITDKKDYMPKAFCTTLGESGIGMSVVVWCKREDFLDTKNAVCLAVVKLLNEAKINIPFNRMDVSILNENTVPQVNTVKDTVKVRSDGAAGESETYLASSTDASGTE